jgi:hypothetical protein
VLKLCTDDAEPIHDHSIAIFRSFRHAFRIGNTKSQTLIYVFVCAKLEEQYTIEIINYLIKYSNFVCENHCHVLALLTPLSLFDGNQTLKYISL